MNSDIKHMHEDLETLKRDIAIIKHVLLQEHQLTPKAIRELEKARKTPSNKYISHEELQRNKMTEPTERQLENRKKALNMSQEDIDDCNKYYELFYGEKLNL